MGMLLEYVGNVSRTLPHFVDLLETVFGRMERIGGPSRVYHIGESNQNGAIYTVGTNGSAIGFGWRSNQVVDTIYWWDKFDFGVPTYALDIPPNVNIEKILPYIKQAITTKRIGEIVI